MDNVKSMYLSDKGRIARLPYFLYALALAVAMFVIAFVLVTILGLFGGLVAYLAVLYPFYCLMAKRLQDFDKPGKWAWIVIAIGLLSSVLSLSASLQALSGLVGLLQLILALIILFMPGTKGSNQYGAPPTN